MKLPLSGVRVLELGRVFAAPFSGQLLADLGAEVIKVEHPERGDISRSYGPPFLRDQDGRETTESSYYLAANRNKKSVAIDFTEPAGLRALQGIAKQSDVLIENFKVGDLARYSLNYEAVKSLNPGIIYCSITGYGQSGPYAPRGGLDSTIQALSGLMSLTGEPDGEPQKVGMIIDDYLCGLYGAIGIMAALRHREVNGGAGQHIDLGLLDVAIAFLGPRGTAYLMSGEEPERIGNASFGSAPAQLFGCRNGHLMVQAGSNDQFRRLSTVLNQAALAEDPRFASRADRWRNLEALLVPLRAAFAQRTVEEWQTILDDAGVHNAPVNTVSEALAHPQVQHRAMVRQAEHAVAGSISMIANPLRFSDTPIETYRAPPTLGQHTDEVLRQFGVASASDPDR